MEKGGGKLVPIRTDKQQRRRPTNVNGWLPTVDVGKRSGSYSAKPYSVQRREGGNEGLICRDQQLITPAAERGHTAAYKPLPKYKFHISPASSPIATVTRTRPRSCKHCVHLFTNGPPRLTGSIHSTLAYAKCRCHRPETTKLQSLRENHHSEATSCKNQASRLHKRVEFAKDTSQNVLPSLTKSLDPHPEQPSVIESSFSELTTSSSKLPTLKSGSLVSSGSSSQLYSSSQHRLTSSGLMRRSSKLLHNSAAKLTPITEGNTTTKKKHVSFKLTDLWKYVSDDKREHLIKLFKSLDSDDDGHISWKQFLSYFNEMDLALKHYLHELYKLTSEATYFGKQEFVLCHGIHELLHCKRLPSSLYLNVDRYFLNTFIIPFLIKMSAMADNGQLNIQQLEIRALNGVKVTNCYLLYIDEQLTHFFIFSSHLCSNETMDQ